MSLSLQSLLIAGAALASVATALLDPSLTGTWTTKSRKVITGPVSIPVTGPLRRPGQSWYSRKKNTLTGISRDFMIRLMTSSWNQILRDSPTHSQMMDSTKKPTIEPFPTVCPRPPCVANGSDMYSSRHSLVPKRHHAIPARQIREIRQRLLNLDTLCRRRPPTPLRSMQWRQCRLYTLHPKRNLQGIPPPKHSPTPHLASKQARRHCKII